MLVIELQNDLVHPSLGSEPGVAGALAREVARQGVLPRLRGLLGTCRARGVPLIYATKERHPSLPQPSSPRIYGAGKGEPMLVAGTWGAQVVEEVAPREGDIVLPRYTSIDPSVGSELWAVAGRLGLSTLVVAGVSTNFAVEGTVRAAANRGLHAVVVEDCCASVPEEWHRFSADAILPLLADVVSCAEVTAALEAWE